MASLPLPLACPSLPRTPKFKKPSIRCAKLEPLYDDGYMKPKGIKEFHDAVSESLRYGEGPPRWFCPVECGPPAEGSPLLLFLPGLDGIGMGLYMHHKALGRIFEVRCMHVPFSDRTTFEGLLMFVEDVVRIEHSTCVNRPIYLHGHSFGGCLALSIAARNPHIDLILILTNPATSFEQSKWQPLFPVFKRDSGQLNIALLFLILYIDNQGKQGMKTTGELNSFRSLGELSTNFLSPLLNLLDLLGRISSETISWKLKLLKLAASHANSRLHAIKAEVLVIASCLDGLLPSREEGEKLAKLLVKCKVYYFENLGHNIITENGFHFCSIIKSSGSYRRARQRDEIKDFSPTTITELEVADKMMKMLYFASSPVIFSTIEEGRIVRGLSGVPDDGPVLLVGNHMLLGIDMLPLVTEFMREKRIVLRGMAHPILFSDRRECPYEGRHFFDFVRLFGAVPVSYRNLYRLLSEKSFVLLYPGGSREALHLKGEEYKLFWPAQPEFVRMAAKFGAKIVPFASVGEDDLGELVLDYEELMSMPFIREKVLKGNQDVKLRNTKFGGRNQDLLIPILSPKIPGRYYYLFGRPISVTRKVEVLEERETANALYLHVKSEVENMISYLLKKREEDAYRSIFHRGLYRAICGPSCPIPSFDP